MSRKRYSVNTTSCYGEWAIDYTAPQPFLSLRKDIIKVTDVLGTRKAKNFTVSIGILDSEATINTIPVNSIDQACVMWALIYKPESVSLNEIRYGDNTSGYTMYEPNQNVIMSGIVGGDDGIRRYTSSLSRNLSSGDTISLILKFINPSDVQGMTALASNIVTQVSCAVSY